MLEDALQLRTQFGELQTVDILLIGWRVRMFYPKHNYFHCLSETQKEKKLNKEYHEMELYKVALISLLKLQKTNFKKRCRL